MSPIEILCLMSLFVVKHFVVDFPLQTTKMVAEKGNYGAAGGIEHSGLHGWATMILVMLFLSIHRGWDPFHAGVMGMLVGGLDFVLHYHIDWAKMNLGRGLTVNDRQYWFLLGIDQMLHYLTYILIIGLIL